MGRGVDGWQWGFLVFRGIVGRFGCGLHWAEGRVEIQQGFLEKAGGAC